MEKKQESQELRRTLQARHLSMIAIGGSIGTGLFLAWLAGKMLRSPKPVAKRAPRAAKKPSTETAEAS